MEKIAVISKDQELVPFLYCNLVEIFEKVGEQWQVVRTASFSPITGNTIEKLRKEAEAIMTLAEDAKAVLCRELSGIPFSVFNQNGYCIFCSEKADQDTFDGMIKDIEESDEKRRRKEAMIQNAGPVETQTPGIYFLDLVQLQKECPEISSKKALLPFLSHTPFLELQLVCAHIPPWLETYDSYEKKVLNGNGKVHITITRKQC
ncbi:Fe-only nitrogenase accessory protein AnfO [Lacrimispora xylanisolvens]|uniref:Fe-only nitrogenase accessory protein AnfO n=1 Tax=Lacrimispora xylanisolvens TaxID=384636 RepID=A0A2S6HWV3_9FIRM|nr:Fe-only nitrogenase accessory AnfO family protein [Hungatella xylanolytica]PPK82393.1 Fe-only nitrogenase accessory protein AnfO [Hungatella xylanolytica]